MYIHRENNLIFGTLTDNCAVLDNGSEELHSVFLYKINTHKHISENNREKVRMYRRWIDRKVV